MARWIFIYGDAKVMLEYLARTTALTAVFVASKFQSFVNAKLFVFLKVGLDKLEELAAVGANGMCVRL